MARGGRTLSNVAAAATLALVVTLRVGLSDGGFYDPGAFAGGACGFGFQAQLHDVVRFQVKRCASASSGDFHVERLRDVSRLSSGVAVSNRSFSTLGDFHVERCAAVSELGF